MENELATLGLLLATITVPISTIALLKIHNANKFSLYAIKLAYYQLESWALEDVHLAHQALYPNHQLE